MIASRPSIVGWLVAAGVALGVGLACRTETPSAPPPTPLALRELASHAYSGVQVARLAVVRDKDEWGTLWREHGGLAFPSSAAPEVDFGTEMVIAVFLGARPTGGYTIAIDGVDETPDGLVVHATESVPPPDALTTQALTAPMHAVAVPRCAQEATLDLREIR